MKTMALLCDHAQVHGGKLFVSGGAISRLMTTKAEPPLVITFALVAVITVPWNATNQMHTMTIELVSDQAGGATRIPLQAGPPSNRSPEDSGMIVVEFNVGRGPDMLPGEEQAIPFALPLPSFPLPTPGSYFFRLCIDGAEIERVPFRAEVRAISVAA